MTASNSIPIATGLEAPSLTLVPSQINSGVAGIDLARFRGALLRWYDQHRRELPWRESRDPYRIWVSEVMLQQTRVAAVLDHYRIFLERFPSVQALAAASADAVLAAWSGLGYYRRARMLHRCAQQIAGEYGGSFPRNSEALLALPGIGRYTAAAIASIAFAEPVAVVDGNVERVLLRLIGANLTTPRTWQQAQTLLDESRPGDFNQAMMELGATVCLPRAPLCTMCPVRKFCVTRGDVPRTAPRALQKKREIWCELDWREANGGTSKGEIRLVQRPKHHSLMPGMWELPQLPNPPRSLSKFKASSFKTSFWRTFRHSITVTDYTVHVLRSMPGQIVWGRGSTRSNGGAATLPKKSAKGRWIAVDRIPEMPITGLTRKILKAGGVF
jgi:A/G-specific adenine glycosylase